MTQRSMFWDGTTTGDAAQMTETTDDGRGYHLGTPDAVGITHDLFFRVLFGSDENRGVLWHWENDLEVTGVATPVAVDTGAALVYGLFYRNTVSENVAVPAPTVTTRYDRIVLRRDWAARTIRIYRIQGTEGGGVPAMIQSPAPDGSGIYDIPLASLQITTGGVITVTDEREYCTFGTGVVDGAIETSMIIQFSVELEQLETRTKSRFKAVEPMANPSRFTYRTINPDYLNMEVNAVPPWNTGGAGLAQGWYCTGGGNYYGFLAGFVVPMDHIPGTDINVYVWSIQKASTSFNIYTAYQLYRPGEAYRIPEQYRTTVSDYGGAADIPYRDEGLAVTDAQAGDHIVYCAMPQPQPNVVVVGFEFEYQAYLSTGSV